jgi:flagellar biosynthesis protein FlhG
MTFPSGLRRTQTVDQAAGLRRLFSARSVRFIPVVANPFVADQVALAERLCAALEDLRLYTLLVDASGNGSSRHRTGGGSHGLASRIDVLTDRIACLPMPEWTTSAAPGGLQALTEAAPLSQAVLVLGSATMLTALFGPAGRILSRPRPIVICDARDTSIRHAYGQLKTLAGASDWRDYDVLMSADEGDPAAWHVPGRLAQCAERFLGGVMHDCVSMAPSTPVTLRSAELLAEFMESSLDAAAAFVLPDAGMHAAVAPQATSRHLQSVI